MVGVSLISLCSQGFAAEGSGPQAMAPEKAKTACLLPAQAGEAVNGLKLVLGTPPEAWYVVGDNIGVPFAFRNTSDKDFSILLDSCCSFYDRVFVVDETGTPCEASMDRERASHPGPQTIRIPAGAGHVQELSLNHWVKIKKPGTYTVWLRFLQTEKDVPANEKSSTWRGEVVSNPVKLTIISPEEYRRRASQPLNAPGLNGISVKLAIEKQTYDLGDPLSMTLQIGNAGNAVAQVPWAQRGSLKRLAADAIVHVAPDWQTRSAGKPTAVEAGKTVTMSVGLGPNHIQTAATGKMQYHAELWIPADLNAAEKNGGKPVEPVRTVSEVATIDIAVTEAGFDRVLAAATKDYAAGKRNRHKSQSLDVLASYFSVVEKWLTARAAKAPAPEAEVASDLLLAKALQPAAPGTNREPDAIRIAADGSARIVPQVRGELVKAGTPLKNSAELAAACVRMVRCSGMLRGGGGGAPIIEPDPETPFSLVREMARAVYDRAKAEDVYIHQLEARIPDVPRGVSDRMALDREQSHNFSMLLRIDSAGDQPLYALTLCPTRDPRPGYVNMWKPDELPTALAALKAAPVQYEAAAALGKFLESLPERHEQISLRPEPGARWQHVRDAATELKKLKYRGSGSLSVALYGLPATTKSGDE